MSGICAKSKYYSPLSVVNFLKVLLTLLVHQHDQSRRKQLLLDTYLFNLVLQAAAALSSTAAAARRSPPCCCGGSAVAAFPRPSRCLVF